MNQSELVEKVAQATELNTRLAGQAVKAVVAAILDSLAAGEAVRVSGLGTFNLVARPARGWAESTKRRGHQNPGQQNSAISRRQSRQGCSKSAEGCGSQEIDSVKEIGSAEINRLRQSQPIEKARKLNGTSSDPPLGPPMPNWLPRQLPPLAVMSGRTCRVEPIDSARHGKALYAADATDRERRLWTYLPLGRDSGREELCA